MIAKPWSKISMSMNPMMREAPTYLERFGSRPFSSSIEANLTYLLVAIPINELVMS